MVHWPHPNRDCRKLAKNNKSTNGITSKNPSSVTYARFLRPWPSYSDWTLLFVLLWYYLKYYTIFLVEIARLFYDSHNLDKNLSAHEFLDIWGFAFPPRAQSRLPVPLPPSNLKATSAQAASSPWVTEKPSLR